ncbi:MAG TPA: hypothetical protein VJV05_00620 [Pyrinomonadaceae bacterium]|nr:hypothetical protein [Pyrinomonadaceae bacterium]
MKLTRSLLALALSFSLLSLSFLAVPIHTVVAKEVSAALQRGYRTGYSDGYMAGYRDVIDKSDKNFSQHQEYLDANRAYNKDYGTIEEYRDGYQQGFESGYDTGFEKRTFDSVVPTTLAKRGIVAAPVIKESAETASTTPITDAAATTAVEAVPAPVEATTQPEPAADTATTTEPAEQTEPAPTTPAGIQKVAAQHTDDPMIIIPRDTELILELQDALDTQRNREGDKFTAKVLAPQEIAGATVEGRVDKIQKPGRIKKRSAMLLSFDKIMISDTRWSNFDAIMTEVLPVKGDNVKRVDTEGTAVGKSTVKPDIIKIGAATGTGTAIGAIAGGPVGAAVGAGVGAAFGVGAVIIERGKHINLRTSQQLRVKTSYETQIR